MLQEWEFELATVKQGDRMFLFTWEAERAAPSSSPPWKLLAYELHSGVSMPVVFLFFFFF